MLSPVEVRLTGENLDTLKQLASRVETVLKETEGTLSFEFQNHESFCGPGNYQISRALPLH